MDTHKILISVRDPFRRTLEEKLYPLLGKPMTRELRVRISHCLREHLNETGVPATTPVPPVHFLRQRRLVQVGEITASLFKELTGAPPKQDDLQRVNCLEVGQTGHFQCGLCEECELPRFQCGCLFSRV